MSGTTIMKAPASPELHSANPPTMRQTAANGPARTTVSANDAPEPMLATLSLGFTRDRDTTRLTQREHYGPLRVQKALYPEGPGTCHAIVVHPPGGVVGGDQLRIDVHAGKDAHVLISTPGAAKWYRSNGRRSVQRITLRVDTNAALEWLPQETIFYNDADVELDSTVDLRGNARYLGCDILCFGRTASGERFASGRVRQRLNLLRDGRPLWLEQGMLAGGSRQMDAPLALSGHTVCASMVAVGLSMSASLMATLRDACQQAGGGRGQFGATQMKHVTIVRYLGDSSEIARAVMLAAWGALRPALLARQAAPLRIWHT